MSEEQNTDFEIHIHKSTTEGEYPVTVYVAGQDRRAEGVFRSPFQQAEVNRALSWMEQGLFDEEFVRQFGSHLFQALFQEQVKEVYVGARQGAPATLRLRLIVDEPEIARIPWELLYDPERSVFLALEFPLVRGASLIEPARPMDALYVILDGAVEISRNGERLHVARQSEILGAWALFDEAPMPVSAKTLEDTRLLRIRRDDFYDLLSDNVEIMAAIFSTLVKRFRKLVEP